MGEEIEIPGEIYGFGNLLLWMVAIRAPSLADQMFGATPARAQTRHGKVNGHYLPTQALIARLIAAAELPTETAQTLGRQDSLRAMVSRAMTSKPHLFRAEWLQAVADKCRLSPADMAILSDGRDEAAKIDYAALRVAIMNTRRRGQRPAGNNAPVTVSRTLPRDAPCFTGRNSELRELAALALHGAQGGRPLVCAVDGMAGSGKSAIAVRFARQFAASFPDGCFYVRLHGHSGDRRPASPLDALAGLLRADKVAPQATPGDLADCARLWQERMTGRRAILILDDAIGPRQVLPLLPGSPETFVLVTSRRRLASLPGAHFLTIGVLDPADAALLFVGLAGRSELAPQDEQVTELMRLCEYLPQAISLLAGHLAERRAGAVADLITPMTTAARLALLVGEHESVAAAFELSYRNLPADLRRLFRRLGLHPGPEIDPWTTSVLCGTDPVSARTQLRRLAAHRLIENPAEDRYRFHGLIADHARILAADDPPADRASAERSLLDYDLHMARAADHFLAHRTATGVPAITTTVPVHIPELPSLHAAIAWLDVNYPQLLAAAGYATAHGYPDHAIAISAAMNGFLTRQGLWSQALDLHLLALAAARANEDRPAIAGLLSDIAQVRYTTGDIDAAIGDLNVALNMHRSLGDPLGEAHALRRLGMVRFATGDYPAVEADFAAAAPLYHLAGDKSGEAKTLSDLGVIQYQTGRLQAAAASQTAALDRYEALSDFVGQADALCYLGEIRAATGDYSEATALCARGLELYRQSGEAQRVAGGLYYLGGVQREAGDHDSAMGNLTGALDAFRRMGDLFDEAGVLNQIGLIQAARSAYAEASATLSQSLILYRSYGSKNGEAEVRNSMGELALAMSAIEEAHSHFQDALTISQAYHMRHQEARAREGIGRCLLRETGQRAAAAESLRQAREIYEDMESPHAERITALLSAEGMSQPEQLQDHHRNL